MNARQWFDGQKHQSVRIQDEIPNAYIHADSKQQYAVVYSVVFNLLENFEFSEIFSTIYSVSSLFLWTWYQGVGHQTDKQAHYIYLPLRSQIKWKIDSDTLTHGSLTQGNHA